MMGVRHGIAGCLIFMGCSAEDAPFQQDILLADGVARQVGAEIESKLLGPVSAGDSAQAMEALSPDFQGRFPRLDAGRVVADDGLDLRVYAERDGENMDRTGLVAVLVEHTEGWVSGERLSFDCDRFFLDLAGEHARGRAEVRMGGVNAAGGRVDLRVECEVELVRDESHGWRLQADPY